MARKPTPTIRRWQLGQELRRIREAAGVKPREAAAEIEVTTATLSRIELGRQTIKPLYVKLLTVMAGVTGEERDALLALCHEAGQPEWYSALAGQAPQWFRQYLGYESAAAELRTYSVELIAGLLQTEDYARAVGLANQPDASGRDLDSYVALRRGRQERLLGDDPPALHAVLNEAAIRRAVGGGKIMAEQLARVIELAKLPHVTVQVLPFAAGAHPAMTAPFTLLGFDTDEMTTVYLENGRGALYLDGAADIERYHWMFDRLTALAFPHTKTLRWLSRVRADL